jgi:hypothetical protein
MYRGRQTLTGRVLEKQKQRRSRSQMTDDTWKKSIRTYEIKPDGSKDGREMEAKGEK